MGKPRLRHIALFASDPKRVAQFYKNVFDMEIVRVSPTANAYFVSDGHINLAILPHSTEGQATRGLNHLGFQVDDQDEKSRAASKRRAWPVRRSVRPIVLMLSSAGPIRRATCSISRSGDFRLLPRQAKALCDQQGRLAQNSII